MAPKNLILRCVLKLNLHTRTFSAVKMKLFEINSSQIETIFQVETRESKTVGNRFTTQKKLHILCDSRIQ